MFSSFRKCAASKPEGSPLKKSIFKQPKKITRKQSPWESPDMMEDYLGIKASIAESEQVPVFEVQV